jgi:site-specific recombinase XerD
MAKTKKEEIGRICSTNTPPKIETLHQFEKIMANWSAKIICKSKKVNRYGLAPLALQCFVHSKKFEIGLGISVKPQKWDDRKQIITGKDKIDIDMNLMVDQYKARVNEILIKFRLENRSMSKEEFIDRFKNHQSREDFIKYFERKAEQRAADGQIEYSTLKTHKVILERCKRFRAAWQFSEISSKMVEEFSVWLYKDLTKSSKRNGKPLKNGGQNTVMLTRKVIKMYLNQAVEDNIRFEMPVMKLKWAQTTREALSKTELGTLIDMYHTEYFMPDVVKHQSLEIFLFAANTGLRISDIKKLRVDDLKDGFITITPHKTRKDYITVHIPETPFITALFKKKVGRIFPPFAEQTINEKLKDIAAQACIEKNVSMNVGRHTFATLWMQTCGDIKSLQDILGHKNLVTTQNYLHKDISHLKDQMQKNQDNWER